MSNWKVRVSDQRMSKGQQGDPLLTLTVDVLGEYINRFEPSFGLKPVTEGTPKKARIFLDFGPQKLTKTLEVLECIGLKDVKASSFHPSIKGAISLVGKEFKAWDSLNPDTLKVSWRIDKNQEGSSMTKADPAKELSAEEVLAFDKDQEDIYQSAKEGPAF